MNRRETLFRIGGIAAAAAFAGRSDAKVDGINTSRLRVGQSVALSGMSGGIGVELQRGWLAAFQQVNRSGGVTRDYQAAMTAAGFADYSYESMEGYVGARTLINGLELCGPYPTRVGLMAALETTHDLGGFFLRFKRGDHEGSSFTELVDVGPNGQLLR